MHTRSSGTPCPKPSATVSPHPSQIIARWAAVKKRSKLHLETFNTTNLKQPPKPSSLKQVLRLPAIPEGTTPHLAPTKVHASTPKRLSLPRDTLSQSIGFRKVEDIIKNFSKIAQPTVTIQRNSSPELSAGELATMKEVRRNTSPTQLPRQYNDVWHIDIGFGPTVGIGGTKYTLMCIDKATRFRRIYGLKNLKSSLLSAMQQFLTDCGQPPKRIQTDFDSKLFASKKGKYAY